MPLLCCHISCHRSVRKESLFIDCSTVDINTIQAIASKVLGLGGHYLDAPVSGGRWTSIGTSSYSKAYFSGVGAATKGTLAFMVGGTKKAYEQACPLLECMGRAAIHCGDYGSGQAAKVCNNMLLAVSMIGTSEALQMGIK